MEMQGVISLSAMSDVISESDGRARQPTYVVIHGAEVQVTINYVSLLTGESGCFFSSVFSVWWIFMYM